jgi:hypothetical protein
MAGLIPRRRLNIVASIVRPVQLWWLYTRRAIALAEIRSALKSGITGTQSLANFRAQVEQYEAQIEELEQAQ